MTGIKSVGEEFNNFCRWLTNNRNDALARIENISNGFEGWIKLEFFFWLTTERKPALCGGNSTEGDDKADVGLEYRLFLDQRYLAMDRVNKKCDLWIRNGSSDHFHYVELKAPFADVNKNKVLKSAADDLWYITRIRKAYEHAITGNTVIFGVRFNDDTWKEALEHIKFYAELPEDIQLANIGAMGPDNKIRWCVFTKVYDSIH